MEAIPKDVIECAILDGQMPQYGDGAEWCEQHDSCYRCAKDIHDMMGEEIRRLKAERDRALAELDKALGEREDAMLSERNAAYNAGFDEGFASADDWYAEHEDAMAEHGWVRLPKDADSEYIHVGDRLEHTNGIFTANDMTISIDGIWRAWDGENGHTVLLAKCRHHKQPTVEDVLRQFLGECESAANLGYDEVPQEVFKDYASKLRLAGDAE